LVDRHRGTGAAALWQGAALRRACGRAAAAPPGQHRPGAAARPRRQEVRIRSMSI
jgi:hypothetical protein